MKYNLVNYFNMIDEDSSDLLKLMYYLGCVDTVLQINIPKRYVDLNIKVDLTVEERFQVINLAKLFNIELLKSLHLFMRVEKNLQLYNQFVDIEREKGCIECQIGEYSLKIKKIMIMNQRWEDTMYNLPLSHENQILDPLTKLYVFVCLSFVIQGLPFVLAFEKYPLFIPLFVLCLIGVLLAFIEPYNERRKNKEYTMGLLYYVMLINFLTFIVLLFYDSHIFFLLFNGFILLLFLIPICNSTRLIEESCQADQIRGISPYKNQDILNKTIETHNL